MGTNNCFVNNFIFKTLLELNGRPLLARCDASKCSQFDNSQNWKFYHHTVLEMKLKKPNSPLTNSNNVPQIIVQKNSSYHFFISNYIRIFSTRTYMSKQM